MKCLLCGREVIKLINSKKYGKKLCLYCYWNLQNNYIPKTNKIIGNLLYIRHKNKKLVFTFSVNLLPIVLRENWYIKEINKIPYLVNSKKCFLLKKLFKADSIDLIKFINNPFDYRLSNVYIIGLNLNTKLKIIDKVPSVFKIKYGYRVKLDSNNYTTVCPTKGKALVMWFLIKECILNKRVKLSNEFCELFKTTTLIDRESIYKEFANKYCYDYLSYIKELISKKSSTFEYQKNLYKTMKLKINNLEDAIYKYKIFLDSKRIK